MTCQLALGLLLVTAGGGAAQQPAPARWLDVFTPLPGARLLCNQHMIGGSPGKHIEIAYTLYATTRPAAEVVRFYADAHKVPVVAGEPFKVRVEGDHKILSVRASTDAGPGCEVEPRPGELTVIMVTEMTSAPKVPDE